MTSKFEQLKKDYENSKCLMSNADLQNFIDKVLRYGINVDEANNDIDKAISDVISFQKNEIEELKKAKIIEHNPKAKVPQFIDDVIRIHVQEGNDPIMEMCAESETWGLNGTINEPYYTKEIASWFHDNRETYYKACVHGYEIEEEPKYQVVFGYSTAGHRFVLTKFKDETYVTKRKKGTPISELEKFTEQEIQNIDKHYWYFKESVEKEVSE